MSSSPLLVRVLALITCASAVGVGETSAQVGQDRELDWSAPEYGVGLALDEGWSASCDEPRGERLRVLLSRDAFVDEQVALRVFPSDATGGPDGARRSTIAAVENREACLRGEFVATGTVPRFVESHRHSGDELSPEVFRPLPGDAL